MMNNESKIYTCEKHVDIGIDDFVNTSHQAPDVEMVKEKKCDYCDKKAVYKIYKKKVN